MSHHLEASSLQAFLSCVVWLLLKLQVHILTRKGEILFLLAEFVLCFGPLINVDFWDLEDGLTWFDFEILIYLEGQVVWKVDQSFKSTLTSIDFRFRARVFVGQHLDFLWITWEFCSLFWLDLIELGRLSWLLLWLNFLVAVLTIHRWLVRDSFVVDFE